MPYQRLPRTTVKGLVKHAMSVLNMFPRKGGISESLSPETLVTGRPKPSQKDFNLEFGTYAQVYDGMSNDMSSHTKFKRRLVLHVFANGSEDTRRSWTVPPITD